METKDDENLREEIKLESESLKLNSEEKKEAYTLMARRNNIILLFLCPAVSVLEAALIIVSIAFKGRALAIYASSFLELYWVMIGVSLAVYAINKFCQHNVIKNHKLIASSTYFYSFFIVFWSFLMTYADFNVGVAPSIGLFFVSIIVVASVFYLNPLVVIPLLVIAVLCQLLSITMVFKERLTDIYMPNLYIFTFAGIFLSIVRYRSLIREVKQSFQVKKAKTEALAANKAKSSFLAVMSHEIRTPMNAIIGLTDMSLRENLPDQVKEYLRQVKTAGSSLLTIINDILDFSKIESGRLEIVNAKYDFFSLVCDVASLVNVRIGTKDLALKIKINPNLPYLLFGDDVRIKQVILNLASNAVKFTEKGSVVIEIDFKKVEKNSEDEKNKIILKIAVKDTGIGIKDEDIGKLFNSFSQVDMQLNRKKEGSGLGLAISKTLVELMGGIIGVTSVYGKGSCFSFELPQIVETEKTVDDFYSLKEYISSDYFANLLADELLHNKKITSALSLNEDKSIPSFNASDAKVLIVDDNPVNLQVASGLMKIYQFQIDTSLSGKDAIEKVKERKYDVVFLDHMMPEMDGIETAIEMQKITKYNDGESFVLPKLVAFTANVLEDVKDKFIQTGFVDFLSKPIETKELDSKLKKLIPENLQSPAKIKKSEKVIESSSKNLKLENLPLEIDVDSGIKNTGSTENYISTLKLFFSTAAENIEKIKSTFSNDIKAFAILVHSLKSAAKIIGAKDLSKEAADLESLAYQNNYDAINKKTPTLLENYRKLQKGLGVFMEKNIDSSSSISFKNEETLKITQTEFEEKLKLLEKPLNDCSVDDAEKIFTELKKYSLSKEKSDMLLSAYNAIENFDFDECKKILSL